MHPRMRPWVGVHRTDTMTQRPATPPGDRRGSTALCGPLLPHADVRPLVTRAQPVTAPKARHSRVIGRRGECWGGGGAEDISGGLARQACRRRTMRWRRSGRSTTRRYTPAAGTLRYFLALAPAPPARAVMTDRIAAWTKTADANSGRHCCRHTTMCRQPTSTVRP